MGKDDEVYTSSRVRLRCVECGVVLQSVFTYRKEAHNFYFSGNAGVVIDIECPEALKKNQHHLVILESLVT